MLLRQTVFLIVVLAVTNEAQIQPTDLVDQVLEQLDELKEIVRGKISRAHRDLDAIIMAFETYASKVITTGTFNLQQRRNRILEQVQTLKDLAQSGGVDPTSCTNQREDSIKTLPDWYIDEMIKCADGVSNETRRITESAKYLVDISLNTVNHLEFEVKRCKEELLCISPILNEIELEKIRLPQNIMTEVQACDSSSSTLRLSTTRCSEDEFSKYSTEAYGILQLIETCINDLLE